MGYGEESIMKIVIPKQYRSKFADGKVCISRWLGHGLIVTNRKMQDEFKRRVNLLIERGERNAQLLRLLTAGVEETKLKKDGSVNLPAFLANWLGKGKLNYKKGDLGLVVSAKKSTKRQLG